jgi:hypothetical protein
MKAECISFVQNGEGFLAVRRRGQDSRQDGRRADRRRDSHELTA